MLEHVAHRAPHFTALLRIANLASRLDCFAAKLNVFDWQVVAIEQMIDDDATYTATVNKNNLDLLCEQNSKIWSSSRSVKAPRITIGNIDLASMPLRG